ncbi:pilin [Vibrio splendidus]|uniref:Prepilin-type cleavage/methylation domain-containing protein n=1 Tax=Vibrio splendidus TaxID=29497 RepID=A0A2T5EK60_VIBSP|nr:pilin [Vibrio splendidus]OEE71615.1 prepilin-type N-terminal cleavage/methylation domain-containing protein [Vibrio splendidus FF-6]PTP20730.1 prepilin-type cleavage/methylation domain-containing protein [Vibrio splendidus]
MNNKNRRTTQKGFTLIELMIVVAVIGVLSAIAMPQYQKYVAKSEVASALATLTGIKTNVEAHTVENGLFPSGSNEETPSKLGSPEIPLGTVGFSRTDNTDGGAITFTFGNSVSDGVSSLVSTKKFTLTRTAVTGAWECKSPTGNDNIPSELLPKTCK